MKANVSRRGFLSAVLVVALVLALGIVPAIAYAVTGASVGFTASGVSCSAYATCAAASGGGAFGRVTVTSGSKIPAGDASAVAYLYKDSQLWKSSGTSYNSVATTSFYAQTTSNATGGYYAAGAVARRLSNGKLNPRDVPATPEKGYRNIDPVFSVEEYEINDNGLEYGSLLSAESVGHEPDLVEAIATNGRSGYLYAADLEQPFPATSEEAVWIAEHPTVEYITVYEVDGVTPVGIFELPYGGTAEEGFVAEAS